jgi:hypothetical protein
VRDDVTTTIAHDDHDGHDDHETDCYRRDLRGRRERESFNPEGVDVAKIAALSIMLGAAVIMAAQSRGPEADMAAAAKALLETLDESQAAKIKWPFDSEERFNWHFIPRERQGLPLKSMDERQRKAAFALLRAGLSAKGYTKVETIRSLEVVLREIEGSARRDPELYFFTIFGEPGGQTWGWRYEGHHIAQNWTISGGKAIGTTPAFLGANPALVHDGSSKGTRALAAEEDLGRALLESLSEAQRKEAVIATTAPNDILTGNSRKAAIVDNAGLSAASMTPAQQKTLMALIEEHATVQAPGLSDQRLAKVRADGFGNIRFAWMGSLEKGPGNGHYYRVQGKSFLIEYDNVQNRANHHHIVWRDFAGDFGTDLLVQHHEQDPHHLEAAAKTR